MLEGCRVVRSVFLLLGVASVGRLRLVLVSVTQHRSDLVARHDVGQRLASWGAVTGSLRPMTERRGWGFPTDKIRLNLSRHLRGEGIPVRGPSLSSRPTASNREAKTTVCMEFIWIAGNRV